MKYAIYILFVAIITMALIYFGYVKDKALPFELTGRLYNKCASKVLKYLKHNKNATIFEIQNCIKDITASVPWSRKRVKVTNPVQFSQYVVDNLYKNKKILIEYKGNAKLYSINSSNR